MAFKTHISDATQNQPGQVTTLLTAILSEGVHDVSRGDFAVTGTAGLAVDVAAGEAFVENDDYVVGTMDQKFFSSASNATAQVAITANSSGNPRIDIICLKIDTAAVPGVQGVGSSSLVAVAGTPAASPVAPAVPDNHLLLAQVAVANGASSISNGNITDARVERKLLNEVYDQPTLENSKYIRGVQTNGTVTQVIGMNANNKISIGTSDVPVENMWWQELARNVLGGNAAAITMTSIPARRFLKVILDIRPSGGTVDGFVFFNGDNAGNYSAQRSSDFGAASDVTSAAGISFSTGASTENRYVDLEMTNRTSEEKLGYAHVTESGGAGAANAPDNRQMFFKWANTVSQVSTIVLNHGGTGALGTGTAVIVLGHD